MSEDIFNTLENDINNGSNNLDEAIEAQIRLEAYAPIQHMTDVGMFMHKSAQDRYNRFSYVNNLLYD